MSAVPSGATRPTGLDPTTTLSLPNRRCPRSQHNPIRDEATADGVPRDPEGCRELVERRADLVCGSELVDVDRPRPVRPPPDLDVRRHQHRAHRCARHIERSSEFVDRLACDVPGHDLGRLVIREHTSSRHAHIFAEVAKREADLRVVVEGVSGRHALLLHAEIVGDELYYGGSMMGLKSRASYHADGNSHLHFAGERHISTPLPPLRHFKGSHLLKSGGTTMLHMLDWNYRVVPDRKHRRRTLVVELEQLAELSSLSLWVVEKGRSDLVDEVLHRPHMPAITHVLVDWTQPMLLAVLCRPSAETWKVLDDAVRARSGSETVITRHDPTDGRTGPWTMPRPVDTAPPK